MAKFMLMLIDKPAAFATLTPAQIQEVIKEYNDWAQQLAAKGKLAGGEKLADEGGKVLKESGGKVVVTDGPFAEAKEVLGGYFIVLAADYGEAVAIARTSPHAKYGAATHIRRIDEIA